MVNGGISEKQKNNNSSKYRAQLMDQCAADNRLSWSLGSGLRNRDGVSISREMRGEPWCLGTCSGHLSRQSEAESRWEMAKQPLAEKAESTRKEGSGCNSCDFSLPPNIETEGSWTLAELYSNKPCSTHPAQNPHSQFIRQASKALGL